jgi:hypothetical protein
MDTVKKPSSGWCFVALGATLPRKATASDASMPIAPDTFPTSKASERVNGTRSEEDVSEQDSEIVRRDMRQHIHPPTHPPTRDSDAWLTRLKLRNSGAAKICSESEQPTWEPLVPRSEEKGDKEAREPLEDTATRHRCVLQHLARIDFAVTLQIVLLSELVGVASKLIAYAHTHTHTTHKHTNTHTHTNTNAEGWYVSALR